MIIQSIVIIDESPECDRAVYYAGRRASRTGAAMVMLLVIEPHGRYQQRLGAADIMKAEAQAAANAILDRFATRANGAAGITPERVIRDGDKAQETSTSSTRTWTSPSWLGLPAERSSPRIPGHELGHRDFDGSRFQMGGIPF